MVRVGPPQLGLEGSASLVTRVSSSSSFDGGQLVDMAYSGGFWYESRDSYALGARYEFAGLGSGHSRSGADRVEASYHAHLLWAEGRLIPYDRDGVGVFVSARLGLVFMHQSATGSRQADFANPAGNPFLCAETSPPNFALGGGAGVDFDIGDRMAFLAQASASMLRGTSEVVGGCVPGLGSPITLNATLGFAYYFGI